MIPIIDLFAGPGGLNEGFSSVGEDTNQPQFRTVASFEMDFHACQTLRLRSAFRALKRKGSVPRSYYEFIAGAKSWEQFSSEPEIAEVLAEAAKEIHQIELGPANRAKTDELIRAALEEALDRDGDDWVLIGGPPCQAYSMAGRSRRRNDKAFEQDKKHFLYREYLRIIENFSPSVFVMENVKGLLSSTNAGKGMFSRILNDLSNPKDGLHYEVRSLVVTGSPAELDPHDFIIKAENYGVPQRRHRVILLGVRADLLHRMPRSILEQSDQVTVRMAIEDLPKIRSGIAPVRDNSWEKWSAIRRAVDLRLANDDVAAADKTSQPILDTGGPFSRQYVTPEPKTEFQRWLLDPRIKGVTLHEARRHMAGDLERYGYLARKAISLSKNPTIVALPDDLQPAHVNIGRPDTPFVDRFRVQLWDAPSTTVVSHIAKDGHYYIHPDSEQMRSLTVREAARLQSFPDNYFFQGSRTQQYSQVGNAVPPFLARQIAIKVAQTLQLQAPVHEGARSETRESVLPSPEQDIQQSSALAF
ncbi:DNA cytosine methyltransferase [Leifsonia sp. A12D58]|uniref:DNA cytosine methyltransferase n=1 Tax=Leifsonia sp. A12D58 TaxID=3397674 RepID=UPI0039E06630